jgi:hypothetical protein
MIIGKAVKIITWMIRDSLTKEMAWDGAMDRKSKMVIRPLGATNNKGSKLNLDSLS